MVSKHVYGPLVILMRILPVLLSMPERGDLCSPVGVPDGHFTNYVLHINQTTREPRCCKNILCKAGEEVVFCSQYNSSTTSCRRCAEGSYSTDNQYSHMNPICRPWRQCNPKLGLVANNDGTSIEDRSCSCDVAKGYYKAIFGACDFKKEQCEADHELDEETGKCERCRVGSEQPVKGYGPCRQCPPNSHKQVGDLTCLSCPHGTYKPDKGSGKCRTCEEFRKRGEHVAECEGLIPGTNKPKLGASQDKDDEGWIAVEVVAVLGVIGFIILISTVVAVTYIIFKRRKDTKPPKSPVKKAARSPTHACQNYAPVPDNSSHSSAEEAIDTFNAKDQNNKNAEIQNTKSKLGPQSPPASDGLPNGGYVGQSPPGHQPNGVAGHANGVAGLPNGVGPYSPPGGDKYYIYTGPSCAIIVGDSGTVHNQNHGMASSTVPPVYVPNQHQGPPVPGHAHQVVPPDCDVDVEQDGHQGQACYDDPADEIAAQYAAGTPC